ncbi:LysM peptidoglycan-binding domain-containing protein [Neisseria chenwenguii]|uniref:Peptidoglycan-binding protein LysM n=1 Tax=Neisseria chenwenguii TaxID=1853278 RepID=A0A220S1N7_9NEIS|nr:LysM domain-containing protein [Neisseria chenwenguii]ASK27384.1 peptidoglycan-binding protein LysM [Neisseria chenwenguii]ROV56945.1 LysM peptidoglycan-binding domain-containing protein [Neisseria chenwenguii]
MQKRIITLLCIAGMAISAQAQSAALKVRPNAPQRYVVKQGDTLWGISGKYLYSPWQWNRLWGSNRSEIRNPHMIYPGQVLVLRYVNGQPRLGFEGGSRASDGIPTVRLHPRMRETSGYGIPTVNVNFYRLFMQHPQFIPPMQTQDAPRLIEGPDSRILYTKGDRVYAYGIKEPGRYLVYRATKDITDPDTKKFLGQEVVFSGIVSTLPYKNSALEARSEDDAKNLREGQYYTRLHPLVKVPTETAQPMVVEEAVSEIRKGDFLYKMTDEGDAFQMMPHAPAEPVQAKVVSISDGISEAGQFQTITLNKGEADGLDKGTVVSLYKRSRQTKVELEKDPKAGRNRSVYKYVSIPAEEVGLAMVYRTNEHLASAIILESLNSVSIGDTASEPGRDLDNMQEDKEHVRNEPQEQHDTPNNQYNFRSNINPY